jgi:hypothetical protein
MPLRCSSLDESAITSRVASLRSTASLIAVVFVNSARKRVMTSAASSSRFGAEGPAAYSTRVPFASNKTIPQRQPLTASSTKRQNASKTICCEELDATSSSKRFSPASSTSARLRSSTSLSNKYQRTMFPAASRSGCRACETTGTRRPRGASVPHDRTAHRWQRSAASAPSSMPGHPDDTSSPPACL